MKRWAAYLLAGLILASAAVSRVLYTHSEDHRSEKNEQATGHETGEDLESSVSAVRSVEEGKL